MSSQQGFTLIELMVSLLVGSVIMFAMGSMLITGMRSNQASESRIDAASIAKSVMADSIAQVLGNASTPLAGNQNTAIPNVTSNVVITPDNEPVGWAQPASLTAQEGVTVSVTINWSDHNVAKSTTLISRAVR